MNSIKNRISVRGYTDKGIDSPKISEIENIISRVINGPFGNSFDFHLLYEGLDGFSGKIGTYGMITGKFGCVFARIEKEEKAYMDYGYCMEKIVLDLTNIGIGTCWLGGTFSKNSLFKAVGVNDSENIDIPAIITFGVSSDTMKLRHKIVGYKSKSKKRKSLDELFVIENNCRIDKEKLTEVLGAVQAAPSAMNGQPWRLIIENNFVHFYTTHGSHVSVQSIDMGISMAHFDLQREFLGLCGTWENLKKEPRGNWTYINSFSIDDKK